MTDDKVALVGGVHVNDVEFGMVRTSHNDSYILRFGQRIAQIRGNTSRAFVSTATWDLRLKMKIFSAMCLAKKPRRIGSGNLSNARDD